MLVLLFKTTSFVLLLLRTCIFLLLLLFIFPYVVSWNSHFSNNSLVRDVLQLERKVSTPIDGAITKVIKPSRDFDTTTLIKIILCLILSSNIKYLYWRTKYYGNYLDQKQKLSTWKNQNNIAQDNNLYLALERKLEQLNNTTNKKDTKKLYAEFVELKKKLQNMSRYFAFLSIDVVNSTGMKAEDDKSLIQLDFLRFKRLVQKNLDNYGCVKSAWTPDGVMACFNTVDHAVKAAQDSIIQLRHFNQHVKQISRDFNVRCGIHSGTICYDETLPLEEITDQVIDIAGHMQKHAEPGTIAISKTSIKPTEETTGFVTNGKVVDEYEVYQWSA